MTARTARHRSAARSTEDPGTPRQAAGRSAGQPQHRGGLRPALGTGLLAVVVVAALGVVVLGVLR